MDMVTFSTVFYHNVILNIDARDGRTFHFNQEVEMDIVIFYAVFRLLVFSSHCTVQDSFQIVCKKLQKREKVAPSRF